MIWKAIGRFPPIGAVASEGTAADGAAGRVLASGRCADTCAVTGDTEDAADGNGVAGKGPKGTDCAPGGGDTADRVGGRGCPSVGCSKGRAVLMGGAVVAGL